MCRIRVLQILANGLEIGVEVLDDLVGLHCFSVLFAQVFELLLLILRQLLNVFGARHVDVGRGVLSGNDLQVLQIVGLLILFHAGRTIDHGVGAGRDLARESTLLVDVEGTG